MFMTEKKFAFLRWRKKKTQSVFFLSNFVPSAAVVLAQDWLVVLTAIRFMSTRFSVVFRLSFELFVYHKMQRYTSLCLTGHQVALPGN